jgi:hypothetical protein
MSSPPSEVSFRLSPSYGLLTAREVHDWFLSMMHEHEEFKVETDRPEEWRVPFWSENCEVGGGGVAEGGVGAHLQRQVLNTVGP